MRRNTISGFAVERNIELGLAKDPALSPIVCTVEKIVEKLGRSISGNLVSTHSSKGKVRLDDNIDSVYLSPLLIPKLANFALFYLMVGMHTHLPYLHLRPTCQAHLAPSSLRPAAPGYDSPLVRLRLPFLSPSRPPRSPSAVTGTCVCVALSQVEVCWTFNS